MKLLTLLLTIISIACNAQVYFRTDSVPAKIIKQDVVTYDTLDPTVSYVPRYLAIQGIGINDTRKFAIIEYRVRIIDIPKPQPPVPEIWEQVDGESATFVGYSYHGTTPAPGWYNNTIAYASTAGSEVTYTFTGRQIEIWAEVQKSGGSGLMSIDDGPEISMTFYSDQNKLPVRIWQSPKLISGTHKFKMRTIGNGNVLLDYFRILK